ncbi:MAG TPA: aminopeptidase P N-terminal domain-containing protein [Solirubrobacterales bacterium]
MSRSDPDLPLPDAPAPPLPPEVFRRRRERLLEVLGDAVAIVPAAPELHRSRDTEVPYRPGSDIYYLTGYPEPQALAVIAGHQPERSFTLFVLPREPEREVWTGRRHGVDGARELTGASAVHTVAEIEHRLFDLVAGASAIHYPIGLDDELDRTVRDLVVRARRGRARSGRGPTALYDLDETLGPLRRVKDAEELERMRTAARIAAAGHRAAIACVAPGVGEWEVQAELEAVFRRHGASGPAFPSIVGSGPNATTLHYTANRRRIEEGDLVLIDAGAEWGMYCSDITRTVPASGRLNGPQRDVYDVVLAAHHEAIEAVQVGSSVADVHEAAVRTLTRGMLDLGLLRDQSVDEAVERGSYRRFYMHQTSHWLGLDVHDVGLYQEGGVTVALVPGMVLTVEPGLYLASDDDTIPEAYRGIGVRIEDTVAITQEGVEILTSEVPTEVSA